MEQRSQTERRFAPILALIFAWVLFGATSLAREAKESPAASRQYAVAVGFQNRRLDRLAIEEWRKFLNDFPDDPRREKARHHLGNCLLRDSQFEAAIAELDKLIATSPQYPQLESARLNLGVARFRRAEETKQAADFDAAARTFAAFLESYPQSPRAPRASFYQAQTLRSAGKRPEAAASLVKLIQVHPQSDIVPDATCLLGMIQAESREPEQAVATFNGLLEKFPQHPIADEARLRLADALFALKKYPEAEALFARLAGSPNSPSADYALLRQARCLVERGQPVEAAALDQTLPQKFPKSSYRDTALLAAGKALFQAGQFAPARQVLATILQPKRPESAEAAYCTGLCLIREKNPAEALRVFDAALAADPPASARPMLTLGRIDAIHEVPERRAESVGLYADIARAFPDAPEAPRALSMAAFAALEVGQLDAARDQAAAFLARYSSHELAPDVLIVAAETDLRAHRYSEAAVKYLNLVQKFPQSGRVEEAKVRRGLAFFLNHEDDQAISTLTPDLPQIKDKALLAQAHFVIGRARADQKRFEPALAALNAVLAAKPDWPQADETLLAIAHCHRSLGKSAEAAATLAKLKASFPQSPILDQAFHQLAEIAYDQGQLDQALAHDREAAKRAGNGPIAALAQLGIGRTLFRQNDLPGAIAVLGDLIQKFPRSDVLPTAHYVRALAEQKLKQYAPAIQDMRDFLGSKPNGDEALDAQLGIGLCQEALGQNDEAAKTLSALIAANPQYPRADQANYELAFALKALGRDAEAAEAFRRLASATPTSPLAAEGLLRAGEWDYASGRFDEAARSFEAARAKTADPGLKEKLLNKLGWCVFKKGDFAGGASAFEHQLAEFPKGVLRVDGLFMAATCDFKQGRWKPARDRFVEVAKTQSPAYQAQALDRAGQCAANLKDWPASVQHFEELLARFPKSDRAADARYGLGWAFQNQGQFAQAIAAYEQVVKETDTEAAAKAQFMIGECYFLQKNHDEAARQFLKGAYGYPYAEWVGNSHFEAARCFEILKQLDQARESYRILVAKYPTHEKAKLAAERLRELGG